MEAVIGAVVGGVLAIAASWLATQRAQRAQVEHWAREFHIQLATDTLSALQRMVRIAIELAQRQIEPGLNGREILTLGPRPDEMTRDYDTAITAWNAARYAVLVGGDPAMVRVVRELDQELDRLVLVAIERDWTKAEFRAERSRLGELLAAYIDEARAKAHLGRLDLATVWTWSDDGGPAPSC